MKNPEEIKRLANKWALDNADRTMETNSALNRGFKGGYNQCQQGNDNKYTIKEVERYHDVRVMSGVFEENRYLQSLNRKTPLS